MQQNQDVGNISDTQKAGTRRTTEVIESSRVSSVSFFPVHPLTPHALCSLISMQDSGTGLTSGTLQPARSLCIDRWSYSGLRGGGQSMSWYNRQTQIWPESSEDGILRQSRAFHPELIGKPCPGDLLSRSLHHPAPVQLVGRPFKVLLLSSTSLVCS